MAKKSKSAERSSSRSAAPSGPRPQSSPVLVIFLVLFVLVSVVMGVLLYMDKDKLTQAKNDVDKANAEKKTATEAYTLEMGYLKAKLKSYFDSAVTNEDETKIREFESRTSPVAGSDLGSWFSALRKKVEGDPDPKVISKVEKDGQIGPYDPRTGKLATNFESKIRDLENKLSTAQNELKATTDKAEALKKEFDSYKVQYSDDTQRDKVADERKKGQKERDDLKKLHDEAQKTFAKNLANVETQLRQGLDEKQRDLDAVNEKAKKELDDLKTQAEREKKVLEATFRGRDIIHFDQPRGQITRVERDRNLVGINLGSEQRVRPQLTFSVYGKGPGGQAEPEPKAHIEVITISGKNHSLARITQLSRPADKRFRKKDGLPATPEDEEFWIKDPQQFHRNRDTIVVGDLIYNPAWDPNHKIRIALGGVFDLDRDGLDDLDAFRKILQDLGVEVVAYIDNKLEIKGKIDYHTDYLVIGEVPEVDVDAVRDEKAAHSSTLAVQLNKLRKEAEARAIEAMDLRRFLARMGYTTIRVPTRTPATIYEPPAKKDEAPEGAAAAPAADKPEKKEEK